MSAYSSKYFQEHAERILSETVSNSDETIVTLDSGEAVVVIPLDQYESWKETQYLLSTPANASRLRQAVADIRAGRAVERTLVEPVEP